MTPRERFRQNQDLIKGFNDTVDSYRMQAAFDAALLHFAENLTVTNDPHTAAANAYRLEGARKYLDTLKNLNTESSNTKPANQTQLHHNV